jgi:hypothetical protein
MSFRIVSENSVTGQQVEFQVYNVDLSIFPNDSNGVPQWNIDESRGFKYGQGNNKNWVKVLREPTFDTGSEYAYVAYFGFKIRWEDWINRTGMPSAFFNASEEHNGFNNDWHQALQVAGWDFKFIVNTQVEVNGELGQYENSKFLSFKDYNSNLQLTKQWNFYRESDGTLINAGVDPQTGEPLGVLLDNERTEVELIWTRGLGVWNSIDEVYATSCIEVDGGAGQFSFRQLSSIWEPEQDNPLQAPSGTLLELTLISPTQVRTRCLVEPSLLEEAIRYKHSARIGCKISGDSGISFIFTGGDPVLDTDNNNFVTA